MALRTSHGHDSSSLRPHALGNMHAPLLLSKQMCNRPFCVLLALPVRQDLQMQRERVACGGGCALAVVSRDDHIPHIIAMP